MARRVVHIDTGREWRGGQRQVYLLARAQRERGDEPLVVGHPDAPLIRRVRAEGLAGATVRVRGEWDLAAARQIRLLIRRWRAEIVHAHDARAHAMGLAALLGERDVPLVVTRRVAFEPRGRMKYGQRVARFIAISHAVRDALVRGGVQPARIDVVYSGVPAPVVEHPRDWRSECSWPADSVICGVVGAMTAEKGIELLGSIASYLSPADASLARLILLGGKDSGFSVIGGIPAFRAGFVDDVHSAMAGLDALWHPATSEGLGTAVIDAMALGVPPVTFDVGGLPELVLDGKTGLLVPPGDVAGFASAAAMLIRDPSLRYKLGSAGPARAAQFSVERMEAGTRRVYDKVLRAARGKLVR